MRQETPDLVEMLRKMILIREFDELAIELRSGRQDLRRRASRTWARRRSRSACAPTCRDRPRDQHPPRPRPLHRQGRRHQAHDGRAVRPRRRLLQGQGRLDAHRRLRGRHAGRQRHRRRRAADRGRRRARRPARGQGRRGGLLLRRRRGRRGRVPRGAQHRLGVEAAVVFVCENNQYAANNAVGVQHPRADIAAHAAAYGMPGVIVDGNDVLAVYAATRDGRRARARAARARPCSSARPIAGTSTRCATRRRRRRRPADEIADVEGARPDRPLRARTRSAGACCRAAEIGAIRERRRSRPRRRRSPSPRRARFPIRRIARRHVRGVRREETHARDHLPAGARRGGGRGDAARPAGHHARHRLHRRSRQGVRPARVRFTPDLRGGADRHGPRRGRLRLSARS